MNPDFVGISISLLMMNVFLIVLLVKEIRKNAAQQLIITRFRQHIITRYKDTLTELTDIAADEKEYVDAWVTKNELL